MTIGALVYLLVALLILGLIAYVIEALFPLPAPFNMIVRIIFIIIALLIVLNAFSVVGRPLVVVGMLG